jgi:hypothetical protein
MIVLRDATQAPAGSAPASAWSTAQAITGRLFLLHGLDVVHDVHDACPGREMDALVDTGAIGSTHTAAARRLLTLLERYRKAAPGDAAAAQ